MSTTQTDNLLDWEKGQYTKAPFAYGPDGAKYWITINESKNYEAWRTENGNRQARVSDAGRYNLSEAKADAERHCRESSDATQRLNWQNGRGNCPMYAFGDDGMEYWIHRDDSHHTPMYTAWMTPNSLDIVQLGEPRESALAAAADAETTVSGRAQTANQIASMARG